MLLLSNMQKVMSQKSIFDIDEIRNKTPSVSYIDLREIKGLAGVFLTTSS